MGHRHMERIDALTGFDYLNRHDIRLAGGDRPDAGHHRHHDQQNNKAIHHG